MDWLSAGIGAVGGLLGQSSANDKNWRIAKAQMDFQSKANQKAMDFSERMSSTAYQRSMADLRKAGLNPILAAGKPASSPGGVSSPGAQATMLNEAAASINGAVGAAQVAKTMQEVRILRQNENIKNPVENLQKVVDEKMKQAGKGLKQGEAGLIDKLADLVNWNMDKYMELTEPRKGKKDKAVIDIPKPKHWK